jgi:predicted transcriptional regulator
MADDGRVITAKLPVDLVKRLDEAAERIDRSKSWIVREAVGEWLAEEQRRHEMTLEALAEVEQGRTVSQEQADKHFEERRRKRSRARAA